MYLRCDTCSLLCCRVDAPGCESADHRGGHRRCSSARTKALERDQALSGTVHKRSIELYATDNPGRFISARLNTHVWQISGGAPTFSSYTWFSSFQGLLCCRRWHELRPAQKNIGLYYTGFVPPPEKNCGRRRRTGFLEGHGEKVSRCQSRLAPVDSLGKIMTQEALSVDIIAVGP